MKILIVTLVLTAGLVICAYAQGPPPAAPANLLAQSPPELQPRVLLSWSGSGPVFYKIYRAVGDTISFQWIGIVQTTKFEDRNVAAGVVYNYVVTAALFEDSILLESPRSNVASVRAYALPAGPKGVIVGQATDAVSGIPIPKVRIRFFTLRPSANRMVEAVTDPAGRYEALIDTGAYFIRAEEMALTVAAPPHIPEWFEDAPLPELATPVYVRLGDTSRVNFALTPTVQPPYAYVSGTVTDEQGNPLAGAVVALVRPIQELNSYAALTLTTPGIGPEAKLIPGIGYTRGVVWIGFTNLAGNFFAQVLSGRPYVAMAALEGYFTEVYDNTTDPTQATVLIVQGDTSGVDFSLKQKTGDTGSMQGSVQDEDGGDVPARIILFPRPKGGDERPAVFVHTDSTGEFDFQDVPVGTYMVLAVPYSEFGTSYYTATGAGAVSWTDGDSIVINGAPSAVTLTVPRLQHAGLTRITGTVRTSTATALAGVRVVARTSDGRTAGYGISDNRGHYAIDALTSGPLTLIADRIHFNLVQASVTVPQTTYVLPGVDFVLSTSPPANVAFGTTIPRESGLHPNYPNPFNPATTITYTVGSEETGRNAGAAYSGSVALRLAIYDVLGREVAVLASGPVLPGVYQVSFNAAGLASGVYFCRLTAGRFTQTRSINLVR